MEFHLNLILVLLLLLLLLYDNAEGGSGNFVVSFRKNKIINKIFY